MAGDPQTITIISSYIDPSQRDQAIADATAFIQTRRADALAMAKRAGFARQGATGNVSQGLVQWVIDMANARNSTFGSSVVPARIGGVDSSLVLGLLLLALAGTGWYFFVRKPKKDN